MRRLATGLIGWLALACQSPGSGCDVQPLELDLAPAAVGEQAVEFYLPPGSGELLGPVLLESLAARDADSLPISLDAIEGSLGGPLTFVSTQMETGLPVAGLALELEESGLHAAMELSAAEFTLTLDVFSDHEPLRTCFLDVHVPAQSLFAAMTLRTGNDGRLTLETIGTPELTGEAVVTELAPDCPRQTGSNVDALVSESVEASLTAGTLVLIDDLVAEATAVIGLDAGAAGSLPATEGGGMLHFLLQPDPEAVQTGPDLRIGLAGGTESLRAACVPPSVLDLPASPGSPTEFGPHVPGTDEPYGMGVSISTGLLQQGLVAAYRAGLFCRLPGSGDLAGVELDDLFPSLASLGEARAVRVALWPAEPPELAFGKADGTAGEILPRMKVTLPGLGLDVFAGFSGTDVRLLGVSADVTLVLVPSVHQGAWSFGLAEVVISDLQVEFSELLGESGSGLRAASAAVIGRVAEALVGDLEPLGIPRPGAAGGELLGVRQTEGRLTLYFSP